MTATLLYRIASVILLLFAAGHTYGFLKFRPETPAGNTVADAMTSVTFEYRGKEYSYGGFYRGFGLCLTAYMLFSAYLSWRLGSLAAAAPKAIGALGWAFAILQAALLGLSAVYFFPQTLVFSALTVIATAWAAWLVR